MTIQTLKFVSCAYFQYITTYGGTIRKIQNMAKEYSQPNRKLFNEWKV